LTAQKVLETDFEDLIDKAVEADPTIQKPETPEEGVQSQPEDSDRPNQTPDPNRPQAITDPEDSGGKKQYSNQNKDTGQPQTVEIDDDLKGKGLENDDLTILLIDAVPLNGSSRTVESLLHEYGVYKEVVERGEWAHWNQDKYGKGKKLLAEVVKSNLQIFKGRTITLNQSIPGNSEILQYLCTVADIIVQGIR
jgi:hypothetical protein